MLRLGWFSTGRDKAARDLLTTVFRSINKGDINAEIRFVFSNRIPARSKETARFFRLVTSYEVPLLSFPSHQFRRNFATGGSHKSLSAFAFLPESMLAGPKLGRAAAYQGPLFDSLGPELLRSRYAGFPQPARSRGFPPRRYRSQTAKLARRYQLPIFPEQPYQLPLLPPGPGQSPIEAEPPPLPSAFERWRAEYDRRVVDTIEGIDDLNPDVCVLAGYMLIVGEEMCRRYKMINLHPAAPGGPAGTWQEVIWQLIESEAKRTGVLMHLVTPELDKGPPVAFSTFPIRGPAFDRYWSEIRGRPVAEIKATEGESNPLFRLIRREGVKREFPLIVTTIKAFAEGRVMVEGGKVFSNSTEVVGGYDLSDEIEEAVGRGAR